MIISKRLGAIAAFVRHGNTVADIGTDHGMLPIYLIEQNICPAAIATDIGVSPAAVARKNITAANLQSRIDVRVGDGLAPVSPDDADDIVIAGMGGETIAEILDAAPWIQNDRYRLILQPMTHAEAVHGWLLTHGFTIFEEHLLEEAGRQYILLFAEYTAAPHNTDPLAHFRGGFTAEEGHPYFLRCANHLDNCAAGATARGDAVTAAHCRALAEKLRNI